MELPKIPGYAYASKIGEGGFCNVYLAQHETLNDLPKFAVKVPKTEEYPIEYEAAVLEWLHRKNIAGIVPYYQPRVQNTFPALVLGYIGDTLEQRLKNPFGDLEKNSKWLQKNISSLKTINDTLFHNNLCYFLDTVEIIDNMNDKGLLHGDLKPSNILLDKNKVILTDFGFSTFVYEKPNSDKRTPEKLLEYILNDTGLVELPKNRYSFSLDLENNFIYLKVSIKTNNTQNRSLLFSKSAMNASRTIQGGTPTYQAPESLQGKFSGKEDQYALARILEEILKTYREGVNGALEKEIRKRGFLATDDQNYTQLVISQSNQRIQYIQKNFLPYNPIERPVIANIRFFAEEMRDDLSKRDMTLWQKIKEILEFKIW
ncbi:MAG: protein kinase [bacterium]|nr:protein kinase [bacterium]